MNENIDLTKILKNCPTGFELYSSVYGEVKFVGIDENHNHLWIDIKVKNNIYVSLTLEGKFSYNYDGECILFPSKDQRDWSKFKAPIKRFNPEEFKPFDKVLLRIDERDIWQPDFFGYKDGNCITCVTYGNVRCIPYNEETKHLAGKRDDCPEYYKWWEK